MRIPPQGKGGVVRNYFCMATYEENTLVMLDAELKKKKERSYSKALKNMKRYFSFKGEKNEA